MSEVKKAQSPQPSPQPQQRAVENQGSSESSGNSPGCGCIGVIIAATLFIGSQVRGCIRDYIAEGQAQKACQEYVDKLDEREWDKKGVKEQCMSNKRGERENERRKENEETWKAIQDVLDAICVLDPDCHFRDRR